MPIKKEIAEVIRKAHEECAARPIEERRYWKSFTLTSGHNRSWWQDWMNDIDMRAEWERKLDLADEFLAGKRDDEL